MSDLEHLRVAVQVLQKDAGTWQTQAKALDEIVNSTSALHMGPYSGTLLAMYRSTYEELLTFYRNRVTEGSAEFNAIARTLNAIVVKYQQQEAEMLREWQRHRELLRQQQQAPLPPGRR